MKITCKEQHDIQDSIYCLVSEILDYNIFIYQEENFYNIIVDYITEIIKIQLNVLYENYGEEVIDSFISYSIINCFNNNKFNFIFRSQQSSGSNNINIGVINNKLQYLDKYCNQEQNSDEWYITRHNYLTASSMWKIFASVCAKNSLIYNKCLPLNLDKYNSTNVNINSTLHWGHKYEPLSIKYYEFMYNTKIKEYGCIPHKKHHCMAASPDGINCDKTSSRYGRLLEIKNIVNRQITGIPKKDYWIQMQIQMEVCDLDDCDFLETRFVEYTSEHDFNLDGNFNTSTDKKPKGIMIAFSDINNNIKYEYSPLNINKNQYDLWEKEITNINLNNNYTWFTNIYWKLDEVSCVLVKRNHAWFNMAIIEIKNVWNIIQTEKLNESYKLRSPKKRKTNINQINNIIVEKCKIDINSL